MDYVFYSAPIDDLSNWTNNGVNYRAQQDPGYSNRRPYLFAPDVVRGNDGRYYLYYSLAGPKGSGGYSGPISVAVSDAPDGQYEYLGNIRNADGTVYDEHVLFDPAVINDDGQIRLYYGACYPFDDLPAWLRPLTYPIQTKIFGKSRARIKAVDSIFGAMAVELADDMLTVTNIPQRIIPTKTKGTEFEGHSFWEASSIRKIGSTYYFVYSSIKSHELCYATSEFPDRGFVYRGTIVSNGDVVFEGRKPEDRVNQTGTNHGSIEQLGSQWFVFYHRNTHGSRWSRQACVEPITILPDGSVPQVEITSTGFHDGPLLADGRYSAMICSSLRKGRMPHGPARWRSVPTISSDDVDRFVGDITSGTVIGYKRFRFDGPTELSIRTRGNGTGGLLVSIDNEAVSTVSIGPSTDWTRRAVRVERAGVGELTFSYSGRGSIDLLDIEFAPLGEELATAPHRRASAP
ncbi:hypothetical protein AWU67_06775 [Microterricola viridarii]|uniref:Glycosyl hydrolases family 43 n=1 Tax=Microterricola viridarii TaxID=412690 RepID=A0A0X8E2P5_9MICO|nr:hypothetical protein AWU67_06775 [Microterricola viridarii]